MVTVVHDRVAGWLCYMTLLRTSSSFFSTSAGVRSKSAATAFCRAGGRLRNASHKSPSITFCTDKSSQSSS